ncbi:MAG: glycerophosphodiester phosphodiesterase [Acidobacteria bacterium]|nr:glycerophosphodiester phosphodiesterase [Acidobacteriota bacterium]
MLAVALAGTVLSAAQDVRPLVIAHRGASGYRPEHTLESYRLAIEMGADAIEPDLVSTKDGILIARHENEIGETTDVAEKFPSRKTTRRIDGREVTGWFTEDFTLAEIRSLRAQERLPFRPHEYDGRFLVPTFDEVIDLAASQSRAIGREIAVYPETKHPTYFRTIGLPLEERLVAVLEKHGLTAKTSPVFIQSFEPSSLQRLRTLTRVRLLQLLDVGADASPARLREIATYANGLGPNKLLVVPVDPQGRLGTPTSLVRDAHVAGLFVHVWTMRRESQFLPSSYDGDLRKEFRQFASLGVDGVFTDFPDMAVEAFQKE